MRTITKNTEPPSLTRYKMTPGACFNGGSPPKEDIRRSLIKEQRGLCCYCQARIRDDEQRTRIEHWQCQERYPHRQLDYTNMMAACSGGEKHGENCPREQQHCDKRRGNDDIPFSPTNTSCPIEGKIKFLGDGRIASDDPVIQQAISGDDSTLNLNISHLVSNRKNVLDAFKQRLGHGSLNPVKELRKWDGSESGELPEFAQVMVYWLRKKIARTVT